MFTIGKRTIPFIAIILFIVACSSASPTTLPTEQILVPPVEPTLEPPTATLPPTEVPAIPTETQVPTDMPLPLGGSGVLVFGSNRDGDYSNIYLMNTADKSTIQLSKNKSNTFPGPYSPNGALLLFTGFGLTNSYVGVMNADGSNVQDLSNRPDTDEGFPTWAPDGLQIAFTSRMEGNNEIYVMNVDGTDVKRLTDNPGDDFAAAWSPDNNLIAFVSDRDNATGVNNLYVMHVDGSDVVRLTNGSEIDYATCLVSGWIADRLPG